MKTVPLFFLIAAVTCGVFKSFAQTWTTNALSPSAFMIASSADGTKLVAACGDGDVYTSTNSGINWAQHLALPNAILAASSADGNILFSYAGAGFNVSTNSGNTWSFRANSPSGQFIVSSADGTKLLTAIGYGEYRLNTANGALYTSTNFGVAWVTNNVSIAIWQAAAASADGNKLVSVINGGGIYTSTNFGAAWISNSVPKKTWASVASSADGAKLVAIAIDNGAGGINGGGFFTSTNSGTTWVSNSAPKPNLRWVSVVSSADGNRLVAIAGGYLGYGPVYSSTNNGQNWISNSLPNTGWTAVASSADGCKLFASAYAVSPRIFSSTVTPPPPPMNITPAINNFTLSWPVPSTNFVLQQSSDPTSWSDLTNVPVLNLTNLQNQVTLPPSAGNSFYRLKTP